MHSLKEFIENQLNEGNPLARLHKAIESGRHFSVLSGQRAGLSKEENAQRHKALKSDINKAGFSHKEVEGHWEGGKEKSIMVYAKDKGDKSGEELRHHTNSLGAKYDQDAVFHHNSEEGHLRGTNTTGYPGKGKSEVVGRMVTNRPSAPFQTETKPKSDRPLKPGRTSKAGAKFTTE